MKKKVLGDTQAFGSHDFLDQLADKVTTVGTHLMDIPLSKIRESENVRRTYEGVDALADSIRGEGLLQPIQVIPGPDGFYDILVGHRRARAYRLLEAEDPAKFGKIPAIVRDAGSLEPREILILQLAENLVREGLSPLDLRDGLERLRQMGLTHREIAQKIGRSEAHVGQLFTTVNTIEKNPAIEGLLRTVAGDSIGVSDIQEVRSLPADLQVEVLTDKAKGFIKSRKDLRKKVQAMKNVGPSSGKIPDEKPCFVSILGNGDIQFSEARLSPAHLGANARRGVIADLEQVLKVLGA